MRILYIDIDSCRPDHLGCYGYHRETSPNIDGIAKEGVRFEQCYTPDAPCLPSRTALYSGRFGIQTGVVGHGGTAAQPRIQGRSRGFRDWFDEQGLARQLQKLGLHTAMISPFGQRHAAHWFYAGFNEIHNTGKGGMESAEEVWPVIDQWFAANVDRTPRDNWFLHVNFWDPHTPYRVPNGYGNPFENAPLPKHLDDDALIARHAKMTGPHTAQDLGMFWPGNPKRWPREVEQINDRASMKKWIDGYDTGIRYVDDYVGRIVERLKVAGIYDDTAIIISADHGENQGELGIYGEHATADVATCRVPMIIKWPAVAPRGPVADLQYNADLAPTLMDLLGGEHQPLWDGRSFAPALRGESASPRTGIVISQCAHVCQRSVRFSTPDGTPWLYMRTYHEGFHLFPDEMLFDLKSDPYEQHDDANAHPEVCRDAAARLQSWHDEQMAHVAARYPHDVVDPLQTVLAEGGPFHASTDPLLTDLPDYLQRLRATGREAGAQALEKRYGHLLRAR